MLRIAVALAQGLLATALLLAGTAAAQSPEKKKITIAVGGKSLFYYMPLTVAERKGYFKEEGLEVEIPDFPGGARALQAMVGGSADMVSGAYEHTINMAAKKQPIKAVVLQMKYSSIALVMSKERAAKYKSPRDLKGLKIGVTAPGSSTNMFVNNLLAKEGLKPTDVAIIGVGTGAGAVAAMEKGEIDAISNLDPVLTQLESTGKFVAVADSRTEKGMKDIYGGDYHASVIYITEEFIRKNPNTVQAVVNAMVRADKWIAKATPQEIIELMPNEYKAGNPSLYKEALLKNMIGFSENGEMSLRAAENVYKVLRQFEPSVQAAGKLDLNTTFDNSFVKKANAKYR
jgi:NitT/TauT family transport system substrate-binding protein